MLRRSSLLAIALTLLFGTATFGAAVPRSYVAGNFALDLEGKSAGFLTSVDGGFASGNVVEESESPDYFVKKHLEDPPAYSDITIEFGLGMSAGVYQWMKDVLDGNLSLRKSGAISALNFNNKVMRRLDFSDAQITRITFPAVSVASKNTATIRLTLTAASTSMSSPGNIYPSAGRRSLRKSCWPRTSLSRSKDWTRPRSARWGRSTSRFRSRLVPTPRALSARQ